MTGKLTILVGCCVLLLGLLCAQIYEAQAQFSPVSPVARGHDLETPGSCSLRAAKVLAARDNNAMSPSIVMCDDFARYGVMIFASEWGSAMHEFVVYRRGKDRGWVRVNQLGFDNTETFDILPNGDLLGQNRFDHRLWRWSGYKFELARKACTYMTWDGARFVLKERPCESGSAASGDRCWRRASEAANYQKKVVRKFRSSGSWNDRAAVAARFVDVDDVGELDCGNFTGAGQTQIAVTLPREPCDGCVEGEVLGKSGGGWRVLLFEQLDCIRPGEKGGFAAAAANLYRYRDSRDSKGGGAERWQYFRWSGSAFIPMRKWLAKRDSSKGSCANPIGMW